MKWVTMWGNAQSIVMPKEATYAKNLTLRYPIYVPFSGDKIRITIDNFVIDESIAIESVSVSPSRELSDEISDEVCYLTWNGRRCLTLEAHQSITSDPVDVNLNADDYLVITIYIKDYCPLTGGVYVQGPLFKGYYGYGDQREEKRLNIRKSMPTNWLYFISNVDIYTNDETECVICYGDSITAQDWPDYMQLKLKEMGVNNVAVIRKAVSGTRILREYDCIKYQSYGLKGNNRFEHEISSVCGAKKIIIQQGINDIIHPVGEDINIFRPMSDLPTAEELTAGLDKYCKSAERFSLETYIGTLLPIYGWRTYAPFREELKNEFNTYIRDFQGCIDFEKEVSEIHNSIYYFKSGYDSGDHLHPSAFAYKAMGELAAEILFSSREK